MALPTVEGTYEDGRVELSTRPEGVERARVIVTFLADPAPPARPRRSPRKRREPTRAQSDRYPAEVRAQYAVLIRKKLDRTLTEDEAARLGALRAEINRLDRESESGSESERQAAAIDAELADLRRELEALPDA